MSAFDNNLKIGDIVSSFYRNKGYWRVIEIKDKFYGTVQYSSDVHLEFVMSLEGVVPKKKARIGVMQASWLSKIDESVIANWRINDENKWNKLTEFVRVKTPEEINEELLQKGVSIPDPEILSFFGPPTNLK